MTVSWCASHVMFVSTCTCIDDLIHGTVCKHVHLVRVVQQELNDIPSLPEEPHHPKNFLFPKRSFGKSKPVLCCAQPQWFSSWPFLHYDEGRDVVFCHTCVSAIKSSRLKFSKNCATAFVGTNYK